MHFMLSYSLPNAVLENASSSYCCRCLKWSPYCVWLYRDGFVSAVICCFYSWRHGRNKKMASYYSWLLPSINDYVFFSVVNPSIIFMRPCSGPQLKLSTEKLTSTNL